MKMEIYGIKTRLIKPGEDIVEIIVKSLEENKIELSDGDVIAIADKVIATADRRIVKLSEITPSQKAIEIAKKYQLEPGFAELVIRESDIVMGGVYRAVLTVRDGIIVANAGIDHKNVPEDCAALWPEDPNKRAREIREKIMRITGKRIGVILVDSRVMPLRRGTVGFALGFSGIKPTIDCRGKSDLYGKPLKITYMNVIDDLAAAAHLLMGETDERVPLVVIKGAPIEITDDCDPDEVKISYRDCIYMKNLIPVESEGKFKK
ncbi:MAG: coenzyme F420-0:L-glutamate ligase [Candidatus Aenigmatarchaeota archaeon]|nr:MAG: coenzyme F420-0:L-glutamate ligase [Candidatus Aenigmarchaeota archaeon]